MGEAVILWHSAYVSLFFQPIGHTSQTGLKVGPPMMLVIRVWNIISSIWTKLWSMVGCSNYCINLQWFRNANHALWLAFVGNLLYALFQPQSFYYISLWN